MAIITSTVKAGQKPDKTETARIRKELREAKRHPLNLDDCPEAPPEVLKEFACMAADRSRRPERYTAARPVPVCAGL